MKKQENKVVPTSLSKEDKEKVYSRMYSLDELYKERVSWKGTYLNKNVLENCIRSYFIDINRVKEFHNIKFADSHKRAAFTIKWIVKLRPIQLVSGHKVDLAKLMVNEYFAIIAGCTHMDVDISNISHKYIRNLSYTFHYRPIDGNVLSSMMYLLEKSLNKESP